MNSEYKEKSTSKSVSLYPAEWQFVEAMTEKHRYPDRSAFFRAALEKAYPGMFPADHQVPPITAAVSTDLEARLEQLEAKSRFFEVFLLSLQNSKVDISEALRVAEQQHPYPKKESPKKT